MKREPHGYITPKMREDILGALPTNWCDPMLTGPSSALGQPPWGCPDVERLVAAIRTELEARIAKYIRAGRK